MADSVQKRFAFPAGKGTEALNREMDAAPSRSKALYPGAAQDNEGHAGTENNDPHRQYQCQKDTYAERDCTDSSRSAIPEHKTASLASPAVFRICGEAAFGAGKPALSGDISLNQQISNHLATHHLAYFPCQPYLCGGRRCRWHHTSLSPAPKGLGRYRCTSLLLLRSGRGNRYLRRHP